MLRPASTPSSQAIASYKSIEEEYWGTQKTVKKAKRSSFSLLDFELIKPFITCPDCIVCKDQCDSGDLMATAAG